MGKRRTHAVKTELLKKPEPDESTVILPPKKEPVLSASTVYLPKELWERLKEIADETKKEDPDGKGYNRNEVIMHFLSWAVEQYTSERKKTKR
jgi:hypothetical protein